MKVVFCGSRDWKDRASIKEALSTLPSGTLVITGGARGADKLAHATAMAADRFATVVMEADWDKYGKRAGFVRNLAMLDQEPDEVWAFWDGESSGTLHTIRECVKRKINLHIVFMA